jgi:hypothetical protein
LEMDIVDWRWEGEIVIVPAYMIVNSGCDVSRSSWFHAPVPEMVLRGLVELESDFGGRRMAWRMVHGSMGKEKLRLGTGHFGKDCCPL